MRQHKIFQNKPKAFLLEEGGAALAVTEGAAREQVCIRVTLIRQEKSAAPSVFACGESSSLKDGAFLALPLGEMSRSDREGLCQLQTLSDLPDTNL